MNAPARLSQTDIASVPPSSQWRAASEPTLVTPRPTKNRATKVLYAACARALEDERVIWDVGCGDGQGTALLASERRTVIGIDPDPAALGVAKANVQAATPALLHFTDAPPEVTAAEEAPDLIVLSDVLGYAEQPDLLLLALCQRAKASTTILLWEPKSEPTQQLPPGKLRAFSTRELVELAALGGWLMQNDDPLCDSFACITATRAPASVVQTLSCLASNVPESQPLDVTGVPPDLAASVYMRRAQRALHARDGNTATAELLAALNVQPKHSAALCALAHLALTCGSTQDALHFLRTCLDSDPTNVAAMQLWVHFLEAAGASEHLAGYQTLANLNPADANVLSTLARLNAENGDPLLAIQDLERLRRYHPTPSLDLSLTLGWLLHSVGRKSDAEVEARLASLSDPDGRHAKELLAAIETS